MKSNRVLRPLAPRDTKGVVDFRFDRSAEQIVADVREHFPEFETQLAREFPDAPLDAFATERPAAIVYVLLRLAENELRRRRRYIASLLRAGPTTPTDADAQAERFAIQNEGDPRGSDQTIPSGRGAAAAQKDRLAGPVGIPPRPPGS